MSYICHKTTQSVCMHFNARKYCTGILYPDSLNMSNDVLVGLIDVIMHHDAIHNYEKYIHLHSCTL